MPLVREKGDGGWAWVAGQLATGDVGKGPSASSSYSSSRRGLATTQACFWRLLSPTVTDGTGSDREPRFPSACDAVTRQLCKARTVRSRPWMAFPSCGSDLDIGCSKHLALVSGHCPPRQISSPSWLHCHLASLYFIASFPYWRANRGEFRPN